LCQTAGKRFSNQRMELNFRLSGQTVLFAAKHILLLAEFVLLSTERILLPS
jgi:hypothetical protein